jgi:hypothetical protein
MLMLDNNPATLEIDKQISMVGTFTRQCIRCFVLTTASDPATLTVNKAITGNFYSSENKIVGNIISTVLTTGFSSYFSDVFKFNMWHSHFQHENVAHW